MQTLSIPASAALAALITYARRIVTVFFIKRTDGSMRRMVCLYDPQEAAAARFKFNPRARGLVPVWDVEKEGVRMIPLDGVRRIVAGGKVVYHNGPIDVYHLVECPPRPTQGVQLETALGDLCAREQSIEAELYYDDPAPDADEEARLRAELREVREEIMRRRLVATIAQQPA